jgi:hypothetical protein
VYEITSLPQESALLLYSGLIGIYLIVRVSFGYFGNRSSISMDELSERVKRNLWVECPFYIRVINVSVGRTLPSLREKIAKSDHWEWTFVAPTRRGVKHYCFYVCEEIRKQYARTKVTTSSLCFLNRAVRGDWNYLFFGRLRGPKGSFQPDAFPEHVSDLGVSPQVTVVFENLFMFKGQYDNVKGSCIITDTVNVGDVKMIENEWHRIREQLDEDRGHSYVWRGEGKKKHNVLLGINCEKRCNQAVGIGFGGRGTSPHAVGVGWHKVAWWVGLMLSPFTLWNDVFVNVPIAVGFAWLGRWATGGLVPEWGLLSGGYLLSNGLGILLMLLASRGLIRVWTKPTRMEVLTVIGYVCLANIVGWLFTAWLTGWGG